MINNTSKTPPGYSNEEYNTKIMNYRNWLQDEEYIDAGYTDPELHELWMFWKDKIREEEEKEIKSE